MSDCKASGVIVGDILLQRRLNMEIPALQQLSAFFADHDFRLGNFESSVYDETAYPNLFPGGGYIITPPKVVSDLARMSFNALNIANNHIMDFGDTGLLKTIETLGQYDIKHCGAGLNLADASRPCFVEGTDARLAMIGFSSSFHDSYAAGPQNGEFRGRPGVNPLKHKAVYTLPREDFETLNRIGSEMGINSYHDQARKEGYLLETDNAVFGPFNLSCGEDYKVTTTPDAKDSNRILSFVHDASQQAEIVIVNFHSHQFRDNNKELAPEFVEIMSRKCIDAGATFVICTGPHVLRGIECYGKGIIFYGLGNFIFHHEQSERLPEEFYNKYNSSRYLSDGVADIMNRRSANGTKGLFTQPGVWESMIVEFHYSRDAINVSLIPIEVIHSDNKAHLGLPKLSCNKQIIQHVKDLSKKYDTSIEIDDDGVGHIDKEK